jgi:putative transposase
MINVKRTEENLPKFNKKRILRIMQINGLVIPRVATKKDHVPTGKIMTLHSNTRWCTDAFEVRCFNSEKVYSAFVMDCCDREVISYVAQTRPLKAEDIQLLMLQSVEARFNNSRTEKQIQFLSDRGKIYRAYNVQHFASTLGLKSCFTASYSPESNGMAEALVKTLKRDYVYQNDCYSSDAVLDMLSNWIEDYNQNAPHSALGMKSPREFIRSRLSLPEGSEPEARTQSRQQPGRALDLSKLN